MLMMAEEGIRGGMCQAVYRHLKANNKHMENCDKNTESSYLEYLDGNNLHGWAMSEKLPVDGFEWIKENDLSKFYEKFIKNYDDIIIKDIFLKQMQNIQKIFINYIAAYHFYLKE